VFPPFRTSRHRSHRRRPLRMSLLAALVAAVGTLGLAVAAAAPAGADNWAPVHSGDFPDPNVMQYDGVYYAFSTQNFASASQTVNIQESTSTDGVHWSQTSADALPVLGSWAEPGNTWAPSVAFEGVNNGDQFIMYYTATERSTPNDQCIGVASSATPEGPYTSSTTPVVCQDDSYGASTIDNGNGGGSIDPDIFTDPSTQTSYLIWKNDGNHVGVPTGIWSVPLAPDLLLTPGTTPTPQLLLANDANSWEGSVIEGPEMYDNVVTTTTSMGTTTTDNFDLFYSGNDEGSANYGIGWASCPANWFDVSQSSPVCTDESTSGPLLASQPGMSGPGGPNIFTLPSGQTTMAFAAWQGTTIGYLTCGIRPMYEATLNFNDSVSPTTPLLSDPNPGVAAAIGPTCPPPPPPPPAGYWQVASDGGVFTFGAASFYGSTGSMTLNKPVVGMAATPSGKGYWLVASDGGIFAYGDAQFYGSTGSMVLNKPIIGMISTLDGGGYWLIASDGGVFAFGDAVFYGSTGGNAPSAPITAAAPGFLDGGYWMVDGNGQVFNFGNAPAEGYPSSAPDGFTVSGIAPTHDDQGYWLSSWNGNVANYGDAPNLGSMYGTALNSPIVGITATRDGGGFWLQGSDGGIFTFGDAPFLGSMGGLHLNKPMVGITSI
jgi:hypothetical protein